MYNRPNLNPGFNYQNGPQQQSYPNPAQSFYDPQLAMNQRPPVNYTQPPYGAPYPNQAMGHQPVAPIQLPPTYQSFYQSNQYDSYLRNLFYQLDNDKNGHITVQELQKNLSNGTMQPFDSNTLRLLLEKYDRNGTGNIEFEEFNGLCNYINERKKLFQTFDVDMSGDINKFEFCNILKSQGYNFSDPILELLFRKFEKKIPGRIIFDDFLRCLLSLEKLSDLFKSEDVYRTGVVNMHYEKFLILALSISP